MSANFISCAPLALGGAPLTVFAPSSVAVTWSESAVTSTGLQDTLASDGKGTLLCGTPNNLIVQKSVDGGKTWAQTAITSSGAAFTISDSLAYGNGIWFGSHAGNEIHSSDGGSHWTIGGAQFPVQPGGSKTLVAYIGGKYLFCSNASADYSIANDTTFSTFTHPNKLVITGAWHDLASDGSSAAAIATPSSGTVSLCVTPDGENWTAHAFANSAGAFAVPAWNADAGVYACAVTSGKTVQIGESFEDLANGAAIAVPFAGADTFCSSVAVDAQGRVLAFGNKGSVSFSVDRGATWVEDKVPWPTNNSASTPIASHSIVAGVDVLVNASAAHFFGLRAGAC